MEGWNDHLSLLLPLLQSLIVDHLSLPFPVVLPADHWITSNLEVYLIFFHYLLLSTLYSLPNLFPCDNFPFIFQWPILLPSRILTVFCHQPDFLSSNGWSYFPGNHIFSDYCISSVTVRYWISSQQSGFVFRFLVAFLGWQECFPTGQCFVCRFWHNQLYLVICSPALQSSVLTAHLNLIYCWEWDVKRPLPVGDVG